MNKTIEIHYETGDSFSNYECNTCIPLVFSNEEALLNALYAIFEHNEYYQKINSDSIHPMEKDRLYNEMKKKAWFYSFVDQELLSEKVTWRDDSSWESFIYLNDDKNEKITIDVFWCGYFETFQDAKIVND